MTLVAASGPLRARYCLTQGECEGAIGVGVVVELAFVVRWKYDVSSRSIDKSMFSLRPGRIRADQVFSVESSVRIFSNDGLKETRVNRARRQLTTKSSQNGPAIAPID